MPRFQRRAATRETSAAPQRAKLQEAAPARAASPRHFAPGAIAQRAVAAPHSLRPAELMAMQQTLGNRATRAMLGRQPIQAKLIVNAPSDAYEREADRMADAVMRMPAVPRQDTPGVELSSVAMIRPGAKPGGDGSFAVDEDFARRLQARQGRGRPLPHPLRETFETRFGADLSGVRIHSDAEAEQLSQAIQAQAFTHGSDIFLGTGKSAIATTAGQHLLAHELTHVVQQGAGPVKTATPPRQLLPQAPVTPSRSGAPAPFIQRLQWDYLPKTIKVAGNTFHYRSDGYSGSYWKEGAGKGYENGNHYTLLGDHPKYVKDIHYSYDIIDQQRSYSAYTWYTVTGDAPNITVSRRQNPEKKDWWTLSRADQLLLERKGGYTWMDDWLDENFTYAKYWAKPVGTFEFDKGITELVGALNTSILANTLQSSKKATASDVNALLSSEEGKEILWQLARQKDFTFDQSGWSRLMEGLFEANVPKIPTGGQRRLRGPDPTTMIVFPPRSPSVRDFDLADWQRVLGPHQ